MGAFAGSAALDCPTLRPDLSVITLTLNNACNLQCPHCYLQFDAMDMLVPDYVVDAVADSPAQTVSIVGKEPLRDRRTIRRLGEIVTRVKRAGRRVGFITNALNAPLLPPEIVQSTHWIDVSVDGTPQSYHRIRGGSPARLLRGVEFLHHAGAPEINILHTISTANLQEVPALADFGRQLGSGKVIFSPYAATRHQGVQPQALSVTSWEFLHALTRKDCDLSRCWVVLDLESVSNDQQRFTQALRTALSDRVILFADDPIRYGMIRVTYDARVMSPRAAMHTRHYAQNSAPRNEQQLRQLLGSFACKAA